MILSLHHVTATVSDAQDDLDFCLDALGLRLVKRTVNFDNHHVHHFYYGTERGAPGTIWTTFPYKDRGVKVGTKGPGQVTATAFSVPAGSLPFWKARLRARGIDAIDLPPRFGEDAIRCSDPSGLVLELIATGRDPRAPWNAGGVDAEAAVRGLHSVTIVVRDPAKTLELMTGLLNYAIVDEAPDRLRVAVQGDAPGRAIDIVADPEGRAAVNGLGTVHHVAMAIDGEDEQLRLREELIRFGSKVTEVRDRCYFKSIYFREPNNVLFEVATLQPGFTADEALSGLGTALKLPPWEEPHRTDIEAALAPIRTSRVTAQ
jgi:glyoxalase family protein